jgi:hypothetical protein
MVNYQKVCQQKVNLPKSQQVLLSHCMIKLTFLMIKKNQRKCSTYSLLTTAILLNEKFDISTRPMNSMVRII